MHIYIYDSSCTARFLFPPLPLPTVPAYSLLPNYIYIYIYKGILSIFHLLLTLPTREVLVIDIRFYPVLSYLASYAVYGIGEVTVT